VDLHIDLVGRRGLADQIYRALRAAILDGRLRAGQVLPATRELARRLQVSRNTVGVAYDRLMGEGFLVTRIGAGTYVCDHFGASASPGRQITRQELMPHERWNVPCPHQWNAVGRPPTGGVMYDFRVGLPDVTLFPFETWRRLVARELRLSAVRTAAYGDPAGHAGLRAAIARHVAVSRAVKADADAVTVTAGAQQAIDLIARVLLGPGDCAAVEEPGYPPVRLLLQSLGARVCPVPVDGQGIVVEAIPRDARLIYVSPSHQFPLGMPMSLARRMELLTWAGEHDAAIIEDDYDSEFRFGGRPIETLYGLDTRGRVLYVGTFSKTMLPAIRLGFLIAPRSLLPALRVAKYASDWFAPLATQAALARFIDEGLLARHTRKMRAEYERRHELVLQVLADQGGWLQPIESGAGMHLTAVLADGQQLSAAAVLERTDGSGVVANPLAAFYANRPAQSGLVLGYGAIQLTKIENGLRLLRHVLSAPARETAGLATAAEPYPSTSPRAMARSSAARRAELLLDCNDRVN
jgi:GntR family transcriptional regulator / MocR family aminotransferase